ncbi:MAG: family 2 glycosyl transferase [Firmicutes bacterium]|nr:family 2 glycosyl transferase [Bacillota bacterium]
MNHLINSIGQNLYQITLGPLLSSDFISVLVLLMPFVLFFEIPWSLFILVGLIRYKLRRMQEGERRPYFPTVSCIVTCYSEGRDIETTVISLAEQLYPGPIQILLVVDGATINAETLAVAKSMKKWAEGGYPNRSVMVLPKWQRGGVVSSSNLALQFATGEIIIKVDGDSSFDNNMVERATRHFEDQSVVAVSGSLRVRNASKTLCAAFQAVEYFIAIHVSKTALSEFNMVNNISGAFGIFRRELLNLVEGWDAGTAEDFDMTLRIKNYFNRSKKKIRIVFDPEAMCFTDVPETFTQFYKQRIRWEGDYPFILYKHRYSNSPQFLGWPNFLGGLVNIFTHVVIPGMVFVYTIWLIFQYRIDFAIALLLAVYLFYLLLLTVFYLVGIALLSERKATDLSRMYLLPLMPLFMFAAKINSFVAVLWEFIGKGHQDTSMAPWWVLRKSKF